MKAWVDELMNEKAGLQIAPLIDVVFLLLIYFMVVSSLKRSEADLQMSLPSAIPQAQALEIPDDQVIEVLPGGQIILNEQVFNDPNKEDLDELEHTLLRYREFSAAMNAKAMVTIAADEESRHERVVDVLNACAGAGITRVTFGSTE